MNTGNLKDYRGVYRKIYSSDLQKLTDEHVEFREIEII
jgi:hypothetical protein